MEISDKIIAIIREMKPSPAPVEKTSNLYMDLGFDSLSFMRLLITIEEACSISINIMEMQMCLRVDRLITLVERKVKEAEYDSMPADI